MRFVKGYVEEGFVFRFVEEDVHDGLQKDHVLRVKLAECRVCGNVAHVLLDTGTECVAQQTSLGTGEGDGHGTLVVKLHMVGHGRVFLWLVVGS